MLNASVMIVTHEIIKFKQRIIFIQFLLIEDYILFAFSFDIPEK